MPPRRDGVRLRVIFLTVRDTQADKVAGLTIGGDDYMTKPFGLDELAARIRTVCAASGRRPSLDDEFADIELDQETYEVRRAGQPLDLSPDRTPKPHRSRSGPPERPPRRISGVIKRSGREQPELAINRGGTTPDRASRRMAIGVLASDRFRF